MTSESFSRPGAVDLSALATAKNQAGSAGAGSGGAAGGAGRYTLDVTDQTFQKDVAERSLSVPVVIDFWAEWCQPCKQLSPVLEKLADEYAGRFVLAKVDVDANPQIAQAMQIQSIPLVAAALRGQLIPLFQGAQPEAQVRAAIEQVLQVAVANGVAGRSEPVSAGHADEAADEPDPRYAEATAALERGDLDGAISAFQALVDQNPKDEQAAVGLARAKLLKRVHGLDMAEVRATAAAKPEDAQAQCTAADLEVAGGHVVDAFHRLVDTVKRTTGEDRDTARLHLLELFEAVGQNDPRVHKARQALSAALF